MRTSEVQGRLLPRSGVGVVPPWLVIAPDGNAAIRLDLRLLDQIGIRSDADDGAPGDRERPCELVLTCGELEVGLAIADGAEAAARVVEAAAPLTRSGSSTATGRVAAAEAPPVEVRVARDPRLVVLASTPGAEPGRDDALADTVFELAREQMLVGRAGDSDIVIDHRSISRSHARLTRDPSTGRYRLAELDATNRVRVNGAEQPSTELEDGDLVDLGHVRLRFEARDDLVFEPAGPPSVERLVIVGPDPVVHRDEQLQIGRCTFPVAEVLAYGRVAANLPLPDDQRLQAALALIVVAAGELDGVSAGEAATPSAER